MENAFQVISGQKDIRAMTTIEVVDYLEAMNNAEITDLYIQNNSGITLWFSINEENCEMNPNERFALIVE